MYNPYPHYQCRTVHNLDGIWDFTFLGAQANFEQTEPQIITYDDRISVPSAFDAMPAYIAERGVAAYRTRVTVLPNTQSRLHFASVGFRCRVFVDSVLVGEHSGAYTPFWIKVPAATHVERELTVVVDNRFDYESCTLHEQYFDFYQYGGILRSVNWHEVGHTYLESIEVRVTDYAVGRVRAILKLGGNLVEGIDVYTSFDKGTEDKHVGVPVIGGEAFLDLTVPRPRPWSTQSPALHTLHIRMKEDDCLVRFGLREVKTEGRQILLNGKPVKLLGYNRHEAHPQFGPSLPIAQMVADLQILKDLGCNFVRGAHYPQDQRFLDLCDEMGFLVFEESMGWNQRKRQLTDPKFIQDQLAATEAMVQTSINHPSVIIWGFLNEGESDIEEARPCYEQLLALIRRLDPTRLVTYASGRPFKDIFHEKCDVICQNYYPGWYTDSEEPRPLFEIDKEIDRYLEYLKDMNLDDRPFLLGEIGAGAIYGWRDVYRSHWSEEYQADCLESICQRVVTDDRIVGAALWQFCDIRTYPGGRALNRPRAFNNKGTLDEYRRPKLAYEVVKRIFATSKA